jgi:hypothetical protein
VLLGFLAGAAIGAVGFQWLGFWFPLSAVAILAGLLVWAIRFLDGTAGSN